MYSGSYMSCIYTKNHTHKITHKQVELLTNYVIYVWICENYHITISICGIRQQIKLHLKSQICGIRQQIKLHLKSQFWLPPVFYNPTSCAKSVLDSLEATVLLRSSCRMHLLGPESLTEGGRILCTFFWNHGTIVYCPWTAGSLLAHLLICTE